MSTTRAGRKREVGRGNIVKKALGKGKATIVESSEEGEEELNLPIDLAEDSNKMAEAEAIREVGRLFTEQMNQQMQFLRQKEEADAERLRLREEAHMSMFKEMIEGQNNSHRIDTETLTNEFTKMRVEKEQARGRQNQKLPNYDGITLTIDDWQDKVEAIMTCNKWPLPTLLEALPTCMSGLAKRAFDSLTEEDKSAKDTFFQKMRIKIDPQSEKKNKDMFMVARKGANESMMTYMDRCRQYIRRSGGDPKEPFALEMLKFKIYDSLSQTDQKILNATVGNDEDLEVLTIKADSMISTQQALIGSVRAGENQAPGNEMHERGTGEQQETPKQPNYYNNIICFNCNSRGHIKRFCPQRLQIMGAQDQFIPNRNQGRPPFAQMGQFQRHPRAPAPFNPNFRNPQAQPYNPNIRNPQNQGGGNQMRAQVPNHPWYGGPLRDRGNLMQGQGQAQEGDNAPLLGGGGVNNRGQDDQDRREVEGNGQQQVVNPPPVPLN